MLGQGEPPAQQPGDVAQPLPGARPQLICGSAGVGAAQQLGGLLERVERALAQVGDGHHPRQVQRVDELGFAAERLRSVDPGRWRSALVSTRDKAELTGVQAGEFLQGAPVRG